MNPILAVLAFFASLVQALFAKVAQTRKRLANGLKLVTTRLLLLRQTHGSMMVIGIIVAVIAVVIIGTVGLVVMFNMKTIIDAYNMTGPFNATKETFFTQSLQAMNLIPIILVVMVAAGIISVLLGAFVIRRGG